MNRQFHGIKSRSSSLRESFSFFSGCRLPSLSLFRLPRRTTFISRAGLSVPRKYLSTSVHNGVSLKFCMSFNLFQTYPTFPEVYIWIWKCIQELYTPKKHVELRSPKIWAWSLNPCAKIEPRITLQLYQHRSALCLRLTTLIKGIEAECDSRLNCCSWQKQKLYYARIRWIFSVRRNHLSYQARGSNRPSTTCSRAAGVSMCCSRRDVRSLSLDHTERFHEIAIGLFFREVTKSQLRDLASVLQSLTLSVWQFGWWLALLSTPPLLVRKPQWPYCQCHLISGGEKSATLLTQLQNSLPLPSDKRDLTTEGPLTKRTQPQHRDATEIDDTLPLSYLFFVREGMEALL